MAELYGKLNRSLWHNKPTPRTDMILKNISHINALDSKGNALLHCIAEENNVALIKIIIDTRKDLNLNVVNNEEWSQQDTALLRSINRRNTIVSKILINSGADVNLSDSHRTTPLLASIISGNTELAVILINSGADVNLCNSNNSSPLLESVMSNNTELAKILLNSGADVNFYNSPKGSITPLHVAVYKNNLQIAVALLQHNANVNVQDNAGQTPLMLFCRSNVYFLRETFNSDMLDLLLSHGADVNILDNTLESPLNIAALVSEEAVNKLLYHKPRFDALDYNGYSTIFLFFKTLNNEDIILRVIEQGCCVKQKDPGGASVLHYAIYCNYKRVAYKLLSDGFDVNCRDSEGNTPLHKASLEDNELLCTLLYFRAEPNLLNNDNTSPLINAIRAGSHRLVDLLFLSYDGLNGDDCHKVVYAVLKNPLANPVDVPTVVAMLSKFEKFIENNKMEFKRYGWKIQYKRWSYAIIKHFLDLNAKIKSFHLMEYMCFSDDNYYYSKLISLGVKNPCLKEEILSMIWFSLSLGITCSYSDFELSSLIVQTLFDKEVGALIWGSHSRQLLSKVNPNTFNNRFGIFYKLLHSDIGSKQGKNLLKKLILFEHGIFVDDDDDDKNNSEDECKSDPENEVVYAVVYESGYESENEHESDDEYKSKFTAKLSKIYSFFMTEDHSNIVFGDWRSYDLPISIKSLAQLSRDKANVFIKQKYKTKNFYQLHEVVNNLDIPNRLKRFLQFRIPVNCIKSRV